MSTRNARKEAISLVYEFLPKSEVPRIAIIPDRASSHAVLYRLVEMKPDEIEEAFTDGAIIPAAEFKGKGGAG